MSARNDYSKWPGTAASDKSSLGHCSCFAGGGFDGAVTRIMVYKGPFAHKMNTIEGVGRGASRVVAIFCIGRFGSYEYTRMTGGVTTPAYESRTVATNHIARFFLSGHKDGQVWLDEEFARHVNLNREPASMVRSSRKFPAGISSHDVHLYISHNSGVIEGYRTGVPGYANISVEQKTLKIDVGSAGRERDEYAPTAGGSFIRSSDEFDIGAIFSGSDVVSCAAGYIDDPVVFVAQTFNMFRGFNAAGGEVIQRSGSSAGSGGNIHLCTWDEVTGGWFVGGRRNVFGGNAELFKFANNDANGNLLAPHRGQADANTRLVTSGLPPTVGDDTHDFIVWGRALNFAGISFEWSDVNPLPRLWALHKIRRDGENVGAWNCHVEAMGSGPEPFDIDQYGNIYFGGPVLKINDTNMIPNQLYRVDHRGENEIQLGTFNGAVFDAKVFGLRGFAGGADQIIVAGDYEGYTSNDSTETDINHLCVLSAMNQMIPLQQLWGKPWKDADQSLDVGDFMPGLIW